MNKIVDLSVRDIAPQRGKLVAPLRAHTFGKSINHVKPFIAAALDNFTLIAPVLFIAATILAVLAVMQTSAFISAFTREIKSTEAKSIAPLLDKKPLLPADYQSAANVIAKNNSAIQIGLSKEKSAIQISIKDPALLPEFMYALVTIQSYRQGVAWSANEICLSKCASGNAATAEITGYTQSISFAGLNAK